MHYYPHHIGDYKAATSHLSNEEDLAYRRLLEMYYDTEQPIPDDFEYLSRRIKVHAATVTIVLKDFFVFNGVSWSNARCDNEIAKYHKIQQGGKDGAAKRWAKASVSIPIAPLYPTQSPPNANQEPRTKNQVIQPPSVSDEVWNSFVKHRKTKKALVTELVVKQIDLEATKAGWTMEAALTEVVTRGWTSFKSDWVQGKGGATDYEKLMGRL